MIQTQTVSVHDTLQNKVMTICSLTTVIYLHLRHGTENSQVAVQNVQARSALKDFVKPAKPQAAGLAAHQTAAWTGRTKESMESTS